MRDKKDPLTVDERALVESYLQLPNHDPRHKLARALVRVAPEPPAKIKLVDLPKKWRFHSRGLISAACADELNAVLQNLEQNIDVIAAELFKRTGKPRETRTWEQLYEAQKMMWRGHAYAAIEIITGKRYG